MNGPRECTSSRTRTFGHAYLQAVASVVEELGERASRPHDATQRHDRPPGPIHAAGHHFSPAGGPAEAARAGDRPAVAPSGVVTGTRVARLLFFAFVLVAAIPAIERVAHPTIHADDIVRIVDLIKHPFREIAFQPYNEHVAVGFNFVTWALWRTIGHDLTLAPLAYSAAAVAAWLMVLALFGYWVRRESGSLTAALVVVGLAAQSPLVLDTAWWYSGSSFTWAIAGVLLALLARRRESTAGAIVVLSRPGHDAGTGVHVTRAPGLAAGDRARRCRKVGVALRQVAGDLRRGLGRGHVRAGVPPGGSRSLQLKLKI